MPEWGILPSLGNPTVFLPLGCTDYTYRWYSQYIILSCPTTLLHSTCLYSGYRFLKRCTNLGFSRLSTYLPTVHSLRVRLRKSPCDDYEPVIDSSFVTAHKRFTRFIVAYSQHYPVTNCFGAATSLFHLSIPISLISGRIRAYLRPSLVLMA